jgi:hypothetical protein
MWHWTAASVETVTFARFWLDGAAVTREYGFAHQARTAWCGTLRYACMPPSTFLPSSPCAIPSVNLYPAARAARCYSRATPAASCLTVAVSAVCSGSCACCYGYRMRLLHSMLPSLGRNGAALCTFPSGCLPRTSCRGSPAAARAAAACQQLPSTRQKLLPTGRGSVPLFCEPLWSTSPY